MYVCILQEKLKHHLVLLTLFDSDIKTLSHHLQNHHLDKVVIQLYLNDDFQGGETEFLYQNRREEATAGDVLIFPAGFTHTHRGNPPIGGEKYIATSWGIVQANDTDY